MKVAVRGLELAQVLPPLWALGGDAAIDGEQAAASICGDGVAPRPDDPPRVVWTPELRAAQGGWSALVYTRPPAAPPPAPEPAPGAAMAEVLAAMRLEYTLQMPQALAVLARAVIDARRGGGSPADARMLAHRLRGTAGSYGHRAIGEAAGRLEDLLVAGELAPGPLATQLLAVAALVVAAVWPGSSPARPRVLVVGAAPPGPADVQLRVPDLDAAARAAAAGEGHALWLASGDRDAVAAVARRPGLRDIPTAIVRDGAVATAAFACLWPLAWSRLFAPD